MKANPTIIYGQAVPDPISDLQRDAFGLLLGDPGLGYANIYKFKEMVPQDVEDQNLSPWKDRSGQKKQGIAIEIRMPAIRMTDPNVRGPQQEVELTLRVMEDPVQNASGTTCESIAWETQQWLDGQIIEDGTVSGMTLYPDPRNPSVRPVYDYTDRFCYDVVMTAQWPQNARDRVVTPTISADAEGNVTITATDQAAPVYYTIDATIPRIPLPGQDCPDNTMIYAAPFLVPIGTVVRWLSWRDGMLPSAVGRAVINAN